MGIPCDNINQKHFTDFIQIINADTAASVLILHYLWSFQDIDKALYVAEFHQEEEQDEC